MARDLSRKQFEAKLKTLGFEPVGFLGYWRLPEGESRVTVSDLNGGDRLRDRLAYLLRERDRHHHTI